jgi:hypothetical protein
MKQHNVFQFSGTLKLIGINPYVSVPDAILEALFAEIGRDKGPIPIKGTVNQIAYRQTLVRYGGEWRLYVNTLMLADSPQRIGEELHLTVGLDTSSREPITPEKFETALEMDAEADAVFAALPPSLKKEIVRYLASLKTEKSLDRNILRAIRFLKGEERFIGRDYPGTGRKK